MECWWVQPSSHDGSVHVHSPVRSVSGTQVMASGWDFADLQNQLDGIVRNKAIYPKVQLLHWVRSIHSITSLLPLPHQALSPQPSFSKRRAKLSVTQCHKHRHENEIYVTFFAVSYDSHMNQSRPHVFK